MAVQAKNSRGPATGMQKSVPPDEISNVRGPTAAGYGQNGGPNNPSSVAPGKRVLSPLAANLESSVDDDGALKSVIARGAKMADSNFETRSESDSQYSAAHGMQSRTVDSGSPGGTIPQKIGASAADDSDARRNAALKR